MQITDLKLSSAEKEDPFAAVVTVTLDREIVIGGIHLYREDEGIILTYPSVDLYDGTRQEIVFPVSQELREDIYLKAVAAFAARDDKQPLSEKI